MLATIIITVFVMMYFLKKNCKPVVQVYPSCPNIPSSQYTDTPEGLCLLNCDQYSDVCYRNCDPKDDECIRECYRIKAQCYMDCMNKERFTSNTETNNVTCGC